MATQLEAITGHTTSHNSVARALGFANSLRPKVPRYWDRKPGWVKDDIREMQRRLSDWEFLAKHGHSIPVWQRP